MSQHSDTFPGRPPRDLLLRVGLFVVLVVACVIVMIQTQAWWTLALAVVALILAAGGIALAVRVMLASDGTDAPSDGGRTGVALATAAVAIAALVLAVALPDEESAAISTTALSVSAADSTVRDFLASAVLDGDAYTACEYLTPEAAGRLAAGAGTNQTCRSALTAARPSFAGLGTIGALRALDLRGALRGGSAIVTASPAGERVVTFVLRPASSAELAAFGAPQSRWRIDSGADAVLSGHA